MQTETKTNPKTTPNPAPTMSAESIFFLCKGAFVLASLSFVPYASQDFRPLAYIGLASLLIGAIWAIFDIEGPK